MKDGPLRAREERNKMNKPKKLASKTVDLLKILQIAVEHSNGRLIIALEKKDKSGKFKCEDRFLKLDGRRIGEDVEYFRILGNLVGWHLTLSIFAKNILYKIKPAVPKSFAEAKKELEKRRVALET